MHSGTYRTGALNQADEVAPSAFMRVAYGHVRWGWADRCGLLRRDSLRRNMIRRSERTARRMIRSSTRDRELYDREMGAAKAAASTEERWFHLERAHIVSQPYPWLHTRNHASMLYLAARQRDRREAVGQLLRVIVAAPGSLTGRYPPGNTGRAAVGLMDPMAIPADLLAELSD